MSNTSKEFKLFAIMVDEKTKVTAYSIEGMFSSTPDYEVIEVSKIWENPETRNVFVVIGSGVVQINEKYIIHKFYIS